MSDITLTSTQRQTLQSLDQVSNLFARTQERLNTGKKVNSVTDDAVAYFRAASLTDRSADILDKKSNIDQSIQSINAALSATSSISTLLTQLQGVLSGARGSSLSQRIASTQQFKDIGKQLGQLVKDATYNGLNILTSTSASLSTQFSERTAATFTVTGYNLTSTAAGNGRSLFTSGIVAFAANGSFNFSNVVASSANGAGTVTGFSALDLTGTSAGQGTVKASVASAIFTNTANRLSQAISQLRGIASALGTNVAILQARSDFSSNYSSTLQTGSDKLTLADLNTEAANSQALTLRQSLGIQSLSVSGTQNQSILTLLR